MSLKNLEDKYGMGRTDKSKWFTEKKVECEGCLFDTGDPKHCLIYPEDAGKEKPHSCKHRRTFREGGV